MGFSRPNGEWHRCVDEEQKEGEMGFSRQSEVFWIYPLGIIRVALLLVSFSV